MIKKLLNYFVDIFSFTYNKRRIELYLSESSDPIDLENRIKELDQSGKYIKFYF